MSNNSRILPSEWSSIQLKGSGHKQQSSFKLLQNNNSLAFVDSCKQNCNDTRDQGWSHCSLVLGEEVDGCSWCCRSNGGEVVGQLVDSHHPGATILGSSNLLFNKHWLLVSGLLCNLLFGEFINGFFVVGGALAKSVDTTLKSIVSGLSLVLVFSHFTSVK